jgi:hypothetical protein
MDIMHGYMLLLAFRMLIRIFMKCRNFILFCISIELFVTAATCLENNKNSESYTETLSIHPLKNGDIFSKFDFQIDSISTEHGK